MRGKKTELIFSLYLNAPTLTKKYTKSKWNTKSRIRNHPLHFHYVTRYELSSQVWEHFWWKQVLDKNGLALKWNAVPGGRLDFAGLRLSLSEICQSSYCFALQIAIELTSRTVGKVKHYSPHYKIRLGACPGQVGNLTFGTVGSF